MEAFEAIKQEYDARKAWGLSITLDIKDCQPDSIRSEEAIREYVIKLCELIDMKRFDEPLIEHFGSCDKVAGYSLVQLIETSCVTAHFANDTNSAYIDIFSCKMYDPYAVKAFSEEFFGGTHSFLNISYRE